MRDLDTAWHEAGHAIAAVALGQPVLFCPTCHSQLVNHLFRVVGTDELVCVFCARHRPAGTVAAMAADSAGFLRYQVDVVDPADAVTLLIRRGAVVERGVA